MFKAFLRGFRTASLESILKFYHRTVDDLEHFIQRKEAEAAEFREYAAEVASHATLREGDAEAARAILVKLKALVS